MSIHFRRLNLPWAMGAAVLWATISCSAAHSITTTYEFSSPPDSVFVTTFPGGVGAPNWPAQVLDGSSGVESVANISFENELNNTLFFDSNALLVGNSSVLVGDFVWADPLSNGLADPSFLRLDFSNRTFGAPLEVAFDYAISADIPGIEVTVFDTFGNSEVIATPRDGTFNFGGNIGTEGNVVLVPIGSLQNIGVMEFAMPVNIFAQLQVGVDNLTFDSSGDADFTGDGSVDGADLAQWESAFGQTAMGDADGDGDSDGRDFLIWQRTYNPSSSGSLQGVAVPEPTAALLAAIGFIALLFRSPFSQSPPLPPRSDAGLAAR